MLDLRSLKIRGDFALHLLVVGPLSVDPCFDSLSDSLSLRLLDILQGYSSCGVVSCEIDCLGLLVVRALYVAIAYFCLALAGRVAWLCVSVWSSLSRPGPRLGFLHFLPSPLLSHPRLVCLPALLLLLCTYMVISMVLNVSLGLLLLQGLEPFMK